MRRECGAIHSKNVHEGFILSDSVIIVKKFLSDNDVNGLEYNSNATTLIKSPVLLRYLLLAKTQNCEENYFTVYINTIAMTR